MSKTIPLSYAHVLLLVQDNSVFTLYSPAYESLSASLEATGTQEDSYMLLDPTLIFHSNQFLFKIFHSTNGLLYHA